MCGGVEIWNWGMVLYFCCSKHWKITFVMCPRYMVPDTVYNPQTLTDFIGTIKQRAHKENLGLIAIWNNLLLDLAPKPHFEVFEKTAGPYSHNSPPLSEQILLFRFVFDKCSPMSGISLRLFSRCVHSSSGPSFLCRAWLTETGCLSSRLPDTPGRWGGGRTWD